MKRRTATSRSRSGGQEAPHALLLGALLDDADAGVVLVDPRGRIAALNAAAGRLLAVTPSSARGAPAAGVIRSVVPGEDLVADGFAAPATDREVVLVIDGGELPALVRTRRVGSPRWLAIVLKDLTQLRRMREDLRRNERLATLGQLSAGVAHEIRNPLAGIGTSAQVLLRRFEPRDDRARFVKVILEEVSRLDRIVTSLLQYARPRTPELRPAALAACVEDALNAQSELLARAGIAVETSVAPKLAPIYIDSDLVRQVMLNVILNAAQAMPQGGTLRIEVRRLRRRRAPRGPGRRASDRSPAAALGAPGWITYQQVRVTDTGSGIPRGVLEKLFDPFFTTKPRGTGLGLSISQTILQEHGGSIEVASREGRGTTVLLNFPLEKRHGERREPRAHARADAHAAHR